VLRVFCLDGAKIVGFLELNRALCNAKFSTEVLTLIISFGSPNTERLGSLEGCAEEKYDNI